MGRIVAVSGSASGIGAATAQLLRDQGDTVVGIDRRDAEVVADLATPEGRRDAVAAVLDATGGALDAVVLCAGLSGIDPLLVSVNYFGVTELLEGLRPALATSAAPRAAVVASVTAIHPADQAVLEACLAGDEAGAVAAAETAVGEGRGRQLYPTSKAALVQWMRTVCVQDAWAGAGIALNAVGPGVVRTAMTDDLMADPEMRRTMDSAIPMPLNGHAGPEPIAASLAWLVSPANSHVTGQILYVDGGAEVTLRGPSVF